MLNDHTILLIRYPFLLHYELEISFFEDRKFRAIEILNAAMAYI